MAEITAALVKDLRDKSGVGMMDCKKALQETHGDMEAAIDWLRTKGLAKAAKKADRVAAEGARGLATRDERRRHDRRAHRAQRRDRLRGPKRDLPGRRARDRQGRPGRGRRRRGHCAARRPRARPECREAMIPPDRHHRREHGPAPLGPLQRQERRRRRSTCTTPAGAPGLGRIGVLVAVEGAGDKAALKELGRKIALHVAGRRRRCRCRSTTSIRCRRAREGDLHRTGARLRASRRPWPRRWSRAASASSTRKWCC